MAGFFLLDDPAAAPDLPDEYGVDDVPVVVQDKEFDDDGQLTLDTGQDEPVAAPALFGGTDVFDVLQLRAASSLKPSPPAPETLAQVPRIAEEEAKVTRELEVAVRMVNGRTMDPERIDEVVTVGTTEIWEVRSIDAFTHNFHIHDVQFQVLDVDGAAPPPALAGWKDTVYLEPRRTYRLVMRFEDYTDPESPYMFHCHLLRHEDEGLMGQFIVVDEGEEPATSVESDGGVHGH